MIILAWHIVFVVLGIMCLVLAWIVGLIAIAMLWPAAWVCAGVRQNHGQRQGMIAFWAALAVSLFALKMMSPMPGWYAALWLIMPPGYYWQEGKKRREKAAAQTR